MADVNAWETKAYWEDRVRTASNLKDMIFKDGRRDEFWARADKLLEHYAAQGHVALEIACGYGRFSQAFAPDKYVGVDFCEGMVNLAREKYPQHTFVQLDAKTPGIITTKYSIIYEVNSLKSLGMTYEQFFERFAPMAKVAVVCVEADNTFIKQIYENGAANS